MLMEKGAAPSGGKPVQSFFEFSFVQKRKAIRFVHFRVLDSDVGPASPTTARDYHGILDVLRFLNTKGGGFNVEKAGEIGTKIYKGCSCGFGMDISNETVLAKIYFAPARIAGDPASETRLPADFVKNIAAVLDLPDLAADLDKAAFLGLNLYQDGRISLKYYRHFHSRLGEVLALAAAPGLKPPSAAAVKALERCFALNRGSGAGEFHLTVRLGREKKRMKYNVSVRGGEDPCKTTGEVLCALAVADPYFAAAARFVKLVKGKISVVTLEDNLLGLYFK